MRDASLKATKGAFRMLPCAQRLPPARHKEAPATEITRASALGWLVCAGPVLRSPNARVVAAFQRSRLGTKEAPAITGAQSTFGT